MKCQTADSTLLSKKERVMNQPTVAQAIAVLERLYPPALAESWDKVGLVVGDPAAKIHKIALAVDPTLKATAQAIEWGADLMVVHHPLLLRPVSSVAATSFKGAIIHRLIKANCALFTAHTNADAAINGVADALAQLLGLGDLTPLVPSVESPGAGIGRVGRLGKPISLRQVGERLAKALPPTHHGVRLAGDLDGLVSTMAVVGGAGDSLFDAVTRAGVDAYLTADLRHHPALEAREAAEFAGGGRPYLIDVSHAASEWAWLERAAASLADEMTAGGARVETLVNPQVADPWSGRMGGNAQ